MISKKALKGDDGCKLFFIRIKEETVAKPDRFSLKANRSRNDLIDLLLADAVERCEAP